MSCPDPEELARYSEGLVSGQLKDEIAAHVDGCSSCREVMVTLARDSHPTDPPGPSPVFVDPEVERPRRGDVIGRYVVLEARGAGGMGLVLSAHDEQLDRKVALKLVRPDIEWKGGAERTRARLLREAQLMARVRHPNVVTVYDVGTLGERIFIAMELVEGRTLRLWLTEKPRTLDEVIAVFLQAGRGLMAAHAAGVVHRDFKPDNVLVDGEGVSHVTDFGIAWSPARDDTGAIEPSAVGEKASGLKGTPAYMAPEQLLGEPVDARSDQFAFCVALYEAALGQRPFVGRDRRVLKELPKKLPAHVEAALRRGLSLKAADRFPDMQSLLSALAPRSSRNASLAVAAVLLVAAAVGATFALTRPGSDCDSAPARLEVVWGAARKAEVQRAFTATEASFAGPAFAAVAQAFDKRSGEWAHAWKTSCEGARSDEVRSRQRVCLEERLQELRSLSDLFAQADVRVVERAAQAATRVKGPQACLSGESLASLPLPDDPKRRRAIAEVRLKLAEAEAQHAAGHLEPSIAAARAAVEMAKATQYPPIEAEAWLSIVEPLRDSGHYEEARRALDDAATAAQAGRHFEAQLLVSIKQVRVVDSAHADEADQSIRRAEAVLKETPRPELQAQLDSVVGVLRLAQRRTKEAIARSQAARKWFEAEGRTAEALGEWHVAALAQRARGDAKTALFELEAAVAQYEKTLGPTHPLTLHVRIHVAEAALDLGLSARALEVLSDPVLDGPGRLTPSWQSMREMLKSDALRIAGRLDEALVAAKLSVELATEATGGARSAGAQRLHLAAALLALERLDEAQAEAVRAGEELEKVSSPTSIAPALARLMLADVWLQQGRAPEASHYASAALERLTAQLEDPGAPERFEALLVASGAARAANEHERAQQLAADALALAAPQSVAAARASIRVGLAAKDPVKAAEGAAVLARAGVYPLEVLSAQAAAPCEAARAVEGLKLAPKASALAAAFVARCRK